MESENIYIYGRRPVEEALLTDPKKVEKIFFRENINIGDLDKITTLASKHKIPFLRIPQVKINQLAGNVNDQGVVALLSGARYVELEEWLKGIDTSKNPSVLLLDEIEDPQNVGAILRSAAAGGASGVIVGKHRQAPISGAVYKASAGQAARIPIIRVGNINDAVGKLKAAGFWIVGLAGAASKSLWEQDFKMPTVIIVGSEGEGIRAKTLEACDFPVHIPMRNGVESLNASVAAGLVLYEWLRQNSPAGKR